MSSIQVTSSAGNATLNMAVTGALMAGEASIDSGKRDFKRIGYDSVSR